MHTFITATINFQLFLNNWIETKVSRIQSIPLEHKKFPNISEGQIYIGLHDTFIDTYSSIK
jgi:hypothetical protein